MSTAQGNLYVISAPSGAGKTSLTRALVEQQNSNETAVVFSISTTTRAPRPGEENGVDYLFVNAEQFTQQVAEGEFLEHAEVFGNCYGTGNSRVMQELATGRDVILEIDWQGAEQVRKQAPDCTSIFILPPSKDELERRLRGRGQDSDEVIQRRMRDAVSEMGHFSEFDYLVINDDFDTALQELNAIFNAQRLTQQRSANKHASLIDSLVGSAS